MQQRRNEPQIPEGAIEFVPPHPGSDVLIRRDLLPSAPNSILPLEFDLSRVPAENQRRMLSAVTDLARTLTVADRNGNGRLDRRERERSYSLKTLAGALLSNALDAHDNGTDFFTTPVYNDARTVARPYELSRLPQAFAIADQPLFDHAGWQRDVATLAQSPLADRVRNLQLPRGAENIRLSDMCRDQSDLPCQTLPDGRVLVYTRGEGPAT